MTDTVKLSQPGADGVTGDQGADIDARVLALFTQPTTVTLTPGYEGANIGTVIGFKHVYYLIEKAVIEHFRHSGLPVGRLYERHGLGFDVVEQSARLQVALFVDDEVVVEVRPVDPPDGGVPTFAVTIRAEREGEFNGSGSGSGSARLTPRRDPLPSSKKAVTATVRVALRLDDNDVRMRRRLPAPAGLSRLIVPRLGDTGTAQPPVPGAPDQPGAPPAGQAGGELPAETEPLLSGGSADDGPVLEHLLAGRNAYGWRFRIPYPYVHCYERLQMSGYVRLMEEAKHRFVDARGISIGRLLAEQNWIPAVTRSNLTLLGEALLEEDLYVVYTVEDIFKNLLYTARVDYYVLRDGRPVRTATGTITHGYGTVYNGCEGGMVQWDDRVAAALRGEPLPPASEPGEGAA